MKYSCLRIPLRYSAIAGRTGYWVFRCPGTLADDPKERLIQRGVEDFDSKNPFDP